VWPIDAIFNYNARNLGRPFNLGETEEFLTTTFTSHSNTMKTIGVENITSTGLLKFSASRRTEMRGGTVRQYSTGKKNRATKPLIQINK
jgi:hypothetical protein